MNHIMFRINEVSLEKKLLAIFSIEIVLISIIFFKSAESLNIFIDEYLSLTSNFNFYKYLDFNAGTKAGGSYSVVLTSGPLSSVGSVIGWSITKNLIVARFTNYLWAFILHIFFINLVSKYYKFNKYIFMIFSGFSLILLPWYFGVLYSIGEIVSTIIFFYAILLFIHNRNASLVLFSLSIFYGKLILIVMFGIFYLVYILINKEINKIFKDFIIFSIPALIWIGLVHLNYENGTVLNYIKDFIYFNFTNNRSAGIKEIDSLSLIEYIFSYKNSEVVNWNFPDFLRVLISPLIFYIITIDHKKLSGKLKGFYSPIIWSTFTLYLWFWILSPTKWIRYSQHFLLVQILLIFFIISQESFKTQNIIQRLLILVYIFTFFNSFEIIILCSIINFILYIWKPDLLKKNLKYVLIFFLFINLGNSLYEINLKNTYEFNFIHCEEILKSDKCYREYLNQ